MKVRKTLDTTDPPLGRELGVPMRLANMAFAEMTEALNRGWENRDSRSPALLRLELWPQGRS